MSGLGSLAVLTDRCHVWPPNGQRQPRCGCQRLACGQDSLEVHEPSLGRGGSRVGCMQGWAALVLSICRSILQVVFDDLFDMLRYRSLIPPRRFLQAFIRFDFIFIPQNICAPYFSKCDMNVAFRAGPIASFAYLRQLVVQPVFAVFARP